MINKFDELKEIISQTLGVKLEDIREDSKFVEDLGADSLDITELVLNIEDHFKIKIHEENVGKFKNVKDVLDFLGRS